MTQKEQRRRLGTNEFDLEDELVEEATATVVTGGETAEPEVAGTHRHRILRRR